MTLQLYTNHNYSNRRIIRHEAPFQYAADGNFTEGPLYTNINFIYGDGITTTQIINYDTVTWPDYASGKTSPSYCLVIGDRNSIESRWWVVDSRITRYGQAQLTLLRDVIADHKDLIMSSPSFVKKGRVASVYDTAIYNNEEMAFNQIKQSETPIKDITGSAWYVGYLNKTLTSKEITIPEDPNAINGQYNNYEAYTYNQYASDDTPFIYDYQSLTFKMFAYGSLGDKIVVGWDENGSPQTPAMDIDVATAGLVGVALANTKQGYKWEFGYVEPIKEVSGSILREAPKYNWMTGLSALTNIKSASQLAQLKKEVGKVYQIGNEYVSPKIRQITYRKNIIPENSNIYVNTFKSLAAATGTLTTEVTGSICGIELVANAYVVEYEKVTLDEITYSFPTTNQKCYKAPFNMFAVPADPVSFSVISSSSEGDITRKLVSDPEVSRRFVE